MEICVSIALSALLFTGGGDQTLKIVDLLLRLVVAGETFYRVEHAGSF